VEHGRTNPTYLWLLDIAGALDVTIGELVTDDAK
jgi:hypothetical protein